MHFKTGLVLLGLGGVYGMIWEGPKSTNAAAVVTASISPRPTVVPELIKRDSWPASFCGFIGASSELGVTCSQHSSCVWNTDYYVVGCCATESKACLFFTSCIDVNSPATAADDPLVFTCRGTKTCFQNQYPSNYHQWGCGYNATFIALTYSNMSNDAATIQQVFMGTKDLIAITTETITVTASAFSAISPSPTATAVHTGPGTATIVGAAVGGSGVLVLGALLLACLMFRRKKKPKPVDGQPAISTPITSSPPLIPSQTLGFHPSVGYYDKDQFHLVPAASPNSMSHSSFLSDGSPNPFFHPQIQPMRGPPTQLHGDDTIYRAYQPPSSPQPISPTPREMDARSFRSFGGVSRKPVGGQNEDEIPQMPSPMRGN